MQLAVRHYSSNNANSLQLWGMCHDCHPSAKRYQANRYHHKAFSGIIKAEHREERRKEGEHKKKNRKGEELKKTRGRRGTKKPVWEEKKKRQRGEQRRIGKRKKI